MGKIVQGDSLAVSTFTHRGDPAKLSFQNSKVWTRQQAFYEREGAKAWTKAVVPSQISTNCFVRDYYLDIFAKSIAADIKVAPYLPEKKWNVVVIELAAGHGLLTLLMARASRAGDLYSRVRRLLKEDKEESLTEELPLHLNVKFVATDFHEGVFRKLLEQDYVQELCREGHVAFSVATAGKGEIDQDKEGRGRLVDIEGREILSRDTIVDRCVFVATTHSTPFRVQYTSRVDRTVLRSRVTQRKSEAIMAQRRANRKAKRRRRKERERERGGADKKRKRGGGCSRAEVEDRNRDSGRGRRRRRRCGRE